MKARFPHALKALALAGLFVSPALADDGTGWLVRLRGVAVMPSEGGNVDGAPTAKIAIDNSVIPELDISYFFTENLATELVLGTTRHTVSAAGVGDITKTNLLPPTLTLQYHFANGSSMKPYVGAGVNYTIFFNTDAKIAGTSMKVKDSLGLALQAGVDIKVTDRTWVNLDVKKLWLDTSAKVMAGNTVAASASDININPWLVGVGVGYKF